jgi:hypothetical protein
MEEVALQNLTKTRANVDGIWLAFVPRAFLQIFITTTLHHRLNWHYHAQVRTELLRRSEFAIATRFIK